MRLLSGVSYCMKSQDHAPLLHVPVLIIQTNQRPDIVV